MYCPKCGERTNRSKDSNIDRYDTVTGKPIFWVTERCPNWSREYEDAWLRGPFDYPPHLNYSFKNQEVT